MTQRVTTDEMGGLVCLCGNTTNEEGWRPCMEGGNPTTKDHPLWPRTYFCERCGLIVRYLTREVIGQR